MSTAISRAEAPWPSASKPLGLQKKLLVIPKRSAVSFISATKAASSPATQWATARAASLPLASMRP